MLWEGKLASVSMINFLSALDIGTRKEEGGGLSNATSGFILSPESSRVAGRENRRSQPVSQGFGRTVSDGEHILTLRSNTTKPFFHEAYKNTAAH